MPKPMDTAPKDGSQVRVLWRDRDGVENTSIAEYRSGGSDPSGGSWWTHVDSDTMKRIQPVSWFDRSDDEDDQ